MTKSIKTQVGYKLTKPRVAPERLIPFAGLGLVSSKGCTKGGVC